eukprot:scaffold9240_cov126-Cylindrotheca_fusiformis.AAC.2
MGDDMKLLGDVLHPDVTCEQEAAVRFLPGRRYLLAANVMADNVEVLSKETGESQHPLWQIIT